MHLTKYMEIRVQGNSMSKFCTHMTGNKIYSCSLYSAHKSSCSDSNTQQTKVWPKVARVGCFNVMGIEHYRIITEAHEFLKKFGCSTFAEETTRQVKLKNSTTLVYIFFSKAMQLRPVCKAVVGT